MLYQKNNEPTNDEVQKQSFDVRGNASRCGSTEGAVEVQIFTTNRFDTARVLAVAQRQEECELASNEVDVAVGFA